MMRAICGPRGTWLLTFAGLVALAGCLPDIATDDQVQAHLDSLADAGEVGDAGGPGDGGLTPDAGDDSATVEDVATDIASDAVECLTPGDCVGKVLGITPCNQPACEKGSCVLQARDEGRACEPVNGATTDQCRSFLCDAQAECAAVPVADGKACGFCHSV